MRRGCGKETPDSSKTKTMQCTVRRARARNAVVRLLLDDKRAKNTRYIRGKNRISSLHSNKEEEKEAVESATGAVGKEVVPKKRRWKQF